MYKIFLKRVFDFCISLIALICFSPILLVITIWLHYANKGAGAFFFQTRVGKDGKFFKIYKYKSMTDERDENGELLPDAQRLTKVGRIVRSTSLDELPQLFNVLKGNMSLVGPRPEIPYYVKEYRKSVPLYMVKHYVKPGITGWAQVNDLRGNDTSIEERIKLDIYYTEHWSVAFDIKILFKTVTKVFFSKNAR